MVTLTQARKKLRTHRAPITDFATQLKYRPKEDGLDRWYKTRPIDSIEKLIDDYTCGCCGILAEVLRRRLGWPVIGVFTWPDSPCHVGLQNPETSLFVDARGFEQTEEQFLKTYFDNWNHLHTIGSQYVSPTPPVIKLIDGPTPFQMRHITHEMCERADLNRLFPGRFEPLEVT